MRKRKAAVCPKKRRIWISRMPFNNIPIKNPGRYFEQFVKVLVSNYWLPTCQINNFTKSRRLMLNVSQVLEPSKGGGQQMALSPAITRRDDYRLGPTSRWEPQTKIRFLLVFYRPLSFSWGETSRHQSSERWRKTAKNWNGTFLSNCQKTMTPRSSISELTWLMYCKLSWHVLLYFGGRIEWFEVIYIFIKLFASNNKFSSLQTIYLQ